MAVNLQFGKFSLVPYKWTLSKTWEFLNDALSALRKQACFPGIL